MARKRLLLAGLVVAALASVIMVPTGALAAPPVCTVIEIANNTCNAHAHNGNGGVTIDVHKHSPGKGGHNGKGGKSAPPPPPPCVTTASYLNCTPVVPPSTPGTPPVTISDLKTFHPAPGTDHMEPDGWMIVGLNTNFYSRVGVQIVTGRLLGQPASVRFTPVSWYWTYGDSKSATRSTKGATWATQGIHDFDKTPTSHIYAKEGTYYIDLDIQFVAEYKYAGGDWLPVIGTLTVPANRLKATAGDAKTVLVGRDCQQNPAGPGC